MLTLLQTSRLLQRACSAAELSELLLYRTMPAFEMWVPQPLACTYWLHTAVMLHTGLAACLQSSKLGNELQKARCCTSH